MKKFNKTITLVLIITFIFSPLLASKAEAQWVVWDPGNFAPNLATAVNTTISAGTDVAGATKEYGLDAVGWIIVNLIISRMAASTVKWINSGFKGSPAFVTNPEAFFGDIGDKVAGTYIFSNPNLNFLCGPIQAKIRLALIDNYNPRRERWQCTLTDVAGNMENFMGDFERGGWDNFFELTQKQQNSPIGAYIMAEGELFEKITNKKDLADKDLLQGKGFMSWKECAQFDSGAKGQTSEGYFDVTYDGDGNEVKTWIPPQTSANVEPKCIREQTNTPGSVISEQLNKQLGLGQDKLAAADEINEIVSALLNQLVSKVIGGVGKGLRSLSSPDSSNNNKTFTDQLSNNSSIVGYFCFDNETDPSNPQYDTDPNVCKYPQTPDTTILDQPAPDLNYDLDSGKPKIDPGYPGQPQP